MITTLCYGFTVSFSRLVGWMGWDESDDSLMGLRDAMGDRLFHYLQYTDVGLQLVRMSMMDAGVALYNIHDVDRRDMARRLYHMIYRGQMTMDHRPQIVASDKLHQLSGRLQSICEPYGIEAIIQEHCCQKKLIVAFVKDDVGPEDIIDGYMRDGDITAIDLPHPDTVSQMHQVVTGLREQGLSCHLQMIYVSHSPTY
jgi:hypothetical protein